jgi:anti-sigma regulatory factor (Ser/Thr protein kinase)
MIVEVADTSQVASVRRAATVIARERGFDEEKAGRVALIATEMASNLLKHATRGHVAMRQYADASGNGVELLALDRGEGIGNVAGAMISDDGLKRMVSHAGTAGQIARKIHEFVYPYVGTPTVILHSDGLSNRWALDDYPGLGLSHPSLIAGILYRDFARGSDDSSIVVMRAA